MRVYLPKPFVSKCAVERTAILLLTCLVPVIAWAEPIESPDSDPVGPPKALAQAEPLRPEGDKAVRIEALLSQPDLPASTRAVTLDEALEEADSRNLSLVEIRMEIEKADVSIRQAWGAVMPTAQAEMQYVRADHADVADLGGQSIEVNPANTVTGGLAVNLPLVNASIWQGIKISKSGKELAGLSIEELKKTVLFSTAKAYYTALMSEALVELYKAQIRSTYHHVAVAEHKLKAGSGLRIDVLRASIDLEKAEKSLSNARLSLATACDALGVLIGKETLVRPKTSAEIRPLSDDENALFEQAQKSRLDLAVQRKNVEIAQEQIGAAWRVLLPSLNLSWKGTYKFTDPGAIGDTDKSRWYLYLNLVVPLFNYGDYPQITGGKVAKRQAEVKIERLMQNMGREVRQAHREYQTSLIDASSAERQWDLAKETLKIAETAFEAGAGTSLEVTDARQTALEAEVNLVSTKLKTQLALLTLLETVGESPLSITEQQSR